MSSSSLVLSERDDSFLKEIWGLYGIGMTILTLRFAIRLRTVGIRGLQWDDFFSLLVVVFYTIDAATVTIVYWSGTNIEGVFLSHQRQLTDAELEQLYEGSKQELLAWYSYSTLVWCLKGTMICFFLRMTAGVTKRQFVKILGYACAISYIGVFCTVTFGCWPIQGNFQIYPDPGIKCTLKPQNFIVMTILNVITDAAILSIPLPMLWTLQVPIRQKLVIGILLSSGVFVITAAIIRIAITLGSAPSAITVNRWGVRETIVGIIAVNTPVLRPMFSKAFWRKQTITGSSSKQRTITGVGTRNQEVHGPYEMAPSVNSRSGVKREEGRTSFAGSEESIINKFGATAQSAPVGGDASRPGDGGVVVHTLYEVTEAPRTESSNQWGNNGFHKVTAYGSSSPV